MEYQSVQGISSSDSLAKTITTALEKAAMINWDASRGIGVVGADPRYEDFAGPRRTTLRMNGNFFEMQEATGGMRLDDFANFAQTKDFSYSYGSSAPYYATAGLKYTYNGVTCANLTQLVILVCLTNANKVEHSLVEKMEEISQNNHKLEIGAEIAKKLAECDIAPPSGSTGWGKVDLSNTIELTDINGTKATKSYSAWASVIGLSFSNGSIDYPTAQEYLKQLNSKLDDLNTISQTLMIELQTLTDQRDQAYELSSNITKLFGTGYMSIASGLK